MSDATTLGVFPIVGPKFCRFFLTVCVCQWHMLCKPPALACSL